MVWNICKAMNGYKGIAKLHPENCRSVRGNAGHILKLSREHSPKNTIVFGDGSSVIPKRGPSRVVPWIVMLTFRP